MTDIDEPGQWLDNAALARLLRVRVDRIPRLIRDKGLPRAFYTLGCRSPRWDKNEIDAWVRGEKNAGAFGVVPSASQRSKDYAEKLHREAAQSREARDVHKGRRP